MKFTVDSSLGGWSFTDRRRAASPTVIGSSALRPWEYKIMPESHLPFVKCQARRTMKGSILSLGQCLGLDSYQVGFIASVTKHHSRMVIKTADAYRDCSGRR